MVANNTAAHSQLLLLLLATPEDAHLRAANHTAAVLGAAQALHGLHTQGRRQGGRRWLAQSGQLQHIGGSTMLIQAVGATKSKVEQPAACLVAVALKVVVKGELRALGDVLQPGRQLIGTDLP